MNQAKDLQIYSDLPNRTCACCNDTESVGVLAQLNQWGGQLNCAEWWFFYAILSNFNFCNSTIAKLQQNHFEDILEKFKNFIELTQLNCGGGGGGKLNCRKTSPKSFLGHFQKNFENLVELAQLNCRSGVGGNSAVAKLQNHFQEIWEKFENLAQLNHSGGRG